MNKNHTASLRGWILGLSLAALATGFLIANINVFDVSLVYLGLFLAVVAVGLFTNLWGGLAASAIAVFALVLLNQYVGIYPVQNRIVNIATELVIFLVAGPLAGRLSHVIEDGQRQINHWISLAEGYATHDKTFNTLKPEWSKIRLEEEVARAKNYSRPLSIALLQFTEIASASRKERVAAFQALIRIARSAALAPIVVAYLGENRVMLILPEHSKAQAQQKLSIIKARVAKELYFPVDGESLGRPLNQRGEIQMAVAELGPENVSADALLQSAASALKPE